MNKIIKVPVVVLNGFLGSGKTTLFRNLISQSVKKNIKVFSIVNDMSEVNIDAQLIAEGGAKLSRTEEQLVENNIVERSAMSSA